ncbi:MAG: hypothetical protein QNI84_15680 [Henriciella sp.]|nr:hypothetical protein [Henriciella sp.]
MTSRYIHSDFKRATQKPKRPAPFSLRLSPDERTRLNEARGDVALGAFIKARLFGCDAVPKQAKRTPTVDRQLLGQLLGQLGASRLSQNMNQIAKASNLGTLPMTVETEADIKRACEDIAVMRYLLMKALGKSAEPPS